MKKHLAIVLAAWLILWWWPLRSFLEHDMTIHMLVQMPILIGLGLLLAQIIRPSEPKWFATADWLGIPGIVAAMFTISFWMLPRALDAAVGNAAVDVIKFLTLPLLAGLPLGLGWPRMPPLGRAFIWANFIPELGAIGGLYLAAPTRLCTYYRLDQQTELGWSLVIVATTLGMSWFIIMFLGIRLTNPASTTRPSNSGTPLDRSVMASTTTSRLLSPSENCFTS